MSRYRFNSSRPAWSFSTPRFTVALILERDPNYTYDGDDENNETQDKLDSGEFVAFDSTVVVDLDGEEIARNSLGGSVYDSDRVREFFTDHRDPDPMNRNCSLMRAARGDNVCICHYFPDMVREAVREARATLLERAATLPRLRGLPASPAPDARTALVACVDALTPPRNDEESAALALATDALGAR